MIGPEARAVGGPRSDDVAITAPIAAAGVLVATGAAHATSVTIPRSAETGTLAMVELVERVAAELGLASQIEVAPRALTVRLTKAEPERG